MSQANDRLERLLGGEALASLRQRIRRRFEREDLDAPIQTMRVTDLTPAERSALAQLTGSPVRSSSSFRLDLSTVDAALADSGVAASLRAALEALDGPIVHLATARATEASRWEGVVARSEHPSVGKWLEAPANLGLLKRLSGGSDELADLICQRAARVLSRLPADGVPLAHLAAESMGDAHALDEGQPAATIVVSVLRGEPNPEDEIATLEDDRARAVWAKAGVMVNELARPALFLNVPFAAADGSNTFVPGQPDYASLRWLMRSRPEWDVAGKDVYVCENPNIVAIAADHLGKRCGPLVCTDGMPAAAQRELLSQLRTAGAKLWYHGDFDWPGIRIANLMHRQHGVVAWHMDETAFAAAVESSKGLGKKLSGTEVVATWAPSLQFHMARHGLAIQEEAVAASLLVDLVRGTDTESIAGL
jgi:uncharacterized protein (TIGR02679 family)